MASPKTGHLFYLGYRQDNKDRVSLLLFVLEVSRKATPAKEETMSTLLRLQAVAEGQDRYTFHANQPIADVVETQGAHTYYSQSTTLYEAFSGWDEVHNLKINEDLWSLSFQLRPGVKLEEALSSLTLILTQESVCKSLLVVLTQ